MYQPTIEDIVVRTMYRIKRAYQKPMTRVLEDLLFTGLRATDTVKVCSVCQREGNNTDCSNCYFGKEGI
jgi:hypothetical protein